jgi:FlaA1/EpsC-like NDP-sugar epimerase
VVPSINKWINGQLSSSQIHDVKIEELLGREPISLENEKITQQIRNKRVLVTGAAGSIGSEIVRQLIQYCPSRIILVDQAESELYNLQQEIFALNQHFGNHTSLVFLIASIKDRFRMNSIFNLYNPDFVYHAAAYKHVPLMEENPYEALMVNVFGTKIIADLALKYQCQRFVMVSTDKAVNPTNVMGASKRIAEMYIQCMSNERTHFITTRFGNVLGSNGSVIPLFKKQIESGGPVTVTHKDITRYFMTIPEACNLVLEASVMGKGGEILIFDMGSSIKIYDLARKMVQLSGLVPGKDIQITEVGLRPGEKLAEELLANEEYTLPTHHPKIMKARVKENGRKEILRCIEELSQIVLEGDNFALVDKMKEIIPEYISNNSIYTKLDARKHKK